MESKTTTVVIAAIVFALAGTLVFAAVAPYLAEHADAIKCGPKGDLNDKEKGCGRGGGITKPGP